MAGQPIDMLSDELTPIHIDAFVDANDQPQEVDAIEWRSSDESVFTVQVSNDGRDVQAVSVDMGVDAPAHGGNLELHVRENGVDDAITETWPVTVRTAQTSPPAVGVRVTVGAAQKKPTP